MFSIALISSLVVFSRLSQVSFLKKVEYLMWLREEEDDKCIRASVSFWPLLIIESVARLSQHVLFTHDLLIKQVYLKCILSRCILSVS